MIVCDDRGCSDRIKTLRPNSRTYAQRALAAAVADPVIIGGRPPGCPREFCGCEASRYLFGEIRPQLNLAANWMRKFPRAAPAPGMAAARRHHVMVLMHHVSGNKWMVHDGNSGGGRTREHVRSIAGYVVVDPRARIASGTE